MEIKLKPCPICDGDVVLHRDDTCLWLIECTDCDWHFVRGASVDEGIEAWNSRREKTCEFTYEDKGNGWWWHCSNCGMLPLDYDLESVPSYCPNCGYKVEH